MVNVHGASSRYVVRYFVQAKLTWGQTQPMPHCLAARFAESKKRAGIMAYTRQWGFAVHGHLVPLVDAADGILPDSVKPGSRLATIVKETAAAVLSGLGVLLQGEYREHSNA